MKPEQSATLIAEAAREFGRRTRRNDGLRVAESLSGGLTLLENSLCLRLHEDVERVIGRDSMLMPVSELKTRQAAGAEIGVYQVVESQVAAVNLGQIGPDDDWYWRWLARLILGESAGDAKVTAQLTDYLAKTPHQRQLVFTNVLARVLPESRRAPLVLFDLFPLAVHITTALALGDRPAADELRTQQLGRQAAIADCRACRGQVLENGRQCPECGNPVWKHEWLVAE
jgi:hypothetical protein